MIAWVIQDKETKLFDGRPSFGRVIDVNKAYLYETREVARTYMIKGKETVRKVNVTIELEN